MSKDKDALTKELEAVLDECVKIQEEVILYLTGDGLPKERLDGLENHLRDCFLCLGFYKKNFYDLRNGNNSPLYYDPIILDSILNLTDALRLIRDRIFSNYEEFRCIITKFLGKLAKIFQIDALGFFLSTDPESETGEFRLFVNVPEGLKNDEVPLFQKTISRPAVSDLITDHNGFQFSFGESCGFFLAERLGIIAKACT